MSQSSCNVDALLEGFTAAGGWINKDVFGLQPFESMGYGAIALSYIQPDTPLFHIPNQLILSPQNSSLKEHLSTAEWESLGTGWSPLILVMMWESSRGQASPWSFYLSSLPTAFDTPMFWTAEQLQALQGTDIERRIGRDEAETEYRSVIAPILASHPDLFPPSSPWFSLDSFHLQGSRILSRSFTIAVRTAGEESDEEEDEAEEAAVMIPMADMLNAAYERDNARLYDDEDDSIKTIREAISLLPGYTMSSSLAINRGEQIFNTYSSPPNSELLRKYGHVDVFPLTKDALSLLSEEEIGNWPLGNQGDEVELEGSLVVEAVKQLGGKSETDLAERVDHWLEEGQEDSFYLSLDGSPDHSLVAFTRILLNDYDWTRFRKKGKMPPATVDSHVHEVVEHAIRARLSRYNDTIMTDITAIVTNAITDQHHRRATIVRIGEKRILHAAIRASQQACVVSSAESSGRKRAGIDESKEQKRTRK